MKQYIAFDIGGTHIKYGIINVNGKVISHSSTDTEANRGGQSIIDKVVAISKELDNDHIAGIAISTAGQVDYHRGVVIAAGDTIPDYAGTEIKKLVSEALQLPVEVRNDVDCAALCEKWLGEHHADNFIALTVGTGIGGAIVLNNEMYSGHSFSAGEWGYMLVEGEQFEKVASITGLINLVKERKENREWTGKEIFELYDQGDQQIKSAVDIFYKHLAIGIANLIFIFNPEKVVLGGGITGRGSLFLDEVKLNVQKYVQPAILDNTEIVLAKYSNQSGMIGAVYHFIQQQFI